MTNYWIRVPVTAKRAPLRAVGFRLRDIVAARCGRGGFGHMVAARAGPELRRGHRRREVVRLQPREDRSLKPVHPSVAASAVGFRNLRPGPTRGAGRRRDHSVHGGVAPGRYRQSHPPAQPRTEYPGRRNCRRVTVDTASHQIGSGEPLYGALPVDPADGPHHRKTDRPLRRHSDRDAVLPVLSALRSLARG